MKQTKKELAQQNHTTILAHILDPENSPLPMELQEQFNRIKSAALMLDNFHPMSCVQRMMAKYNISRTTARRDIDMAQSLFKSNHTFDFDFWQQWQIKDLVDSIRKCKIRGDEKNRIAAHKALKLIIGEKVATDEDPRRMEKNVFYIQLNNNGTILNMDLNAIKGLSKDEVKTVVEALSAPEKTDDEVVDILNT